MLVPALLMQATDERSFCILRGVISDEDYTPLPRRDI
jgi:hypothetical protein